MISTLDLMSPEEFDELLFGLVRMDLGGMVTAYNQTEAALSGLSAEKVLGKNFFNQIAPCTNNYLVAQRFETEPELDATIDYVFTLKMRPTKVTLRMLQHASSPNAYLLIAKRT